MSGFYLLGGGGGRGCRGEASPPNTLAPPENTLSVFAAIQKIGIVEILKCSPQI